KSVLVPERTVIDAVIKNGVAESAAVGDAITAFVTTPVSIKERTVIPSGAQLRGSLEELSVGRGTAKVTVNFTVLLIEDRNFTVQTRTVAAIIPVLRRALIPSTPTKFLSGLTPAQKKLVLQSAELRKVQADRVIVNAGDPATSLFLLKHGRAKYYRITKKGEEVVLWWLTAGDTFGIGTLLAMPINYIGTAQALDECELLVWSRNRIRLLAEKHRILAQNALHIILYCLAAYTERLIGLATGTAEERLAYTLLQLARRAGHMRPDGAELTILN